MAGNEGTAVAVFLAVDSWLVRLPVQGGLELFFDNGGLVLNDQHLMSPMHHGPQSEGAERPGQVDLDDAQTEVVLVVWAEAEVVEGAQGRGIRQPRGNDGHTRANRLAGDAVEAGELGVLVDPRDAHGVQVFFRLEGARPEQRARVPETGLIGRRNSQGSERRDGDGGAGVGQIGHDFERAPESGVAGERDGMKAKRDDVAHRRGGQDREPKGPRHLLARAGQRRGLRHGVVPHQRHGTPQGRRARNAGMADGVSRSIEPGVLPVPEAHHAVDAPTRQLASQLGPAHGRGRQLLVETGGEHDVRRRQELVRPLELLIEAAERRTFVAADEESCREFPEAIETPLRQQKADDGLNAREQHAALQCLVAVADAHGAHRLVRFSQSGMVTGRPRRADAQCSATWRGREWLVTDSSRSSAVRASDRIQGELEAGGVPSRTLGMDLQDASGIRNKVGHIGDPALRESFGVGSLGQHVIGRPDHERTLELFDRRRVEHSSRRTRGEDVAGEGVSCLWRHDRGPDGLGHLRRPRRIDIGYGEDGASLGEKFGER